MSRMAIGIAEFIHQQHRVKLRHYQDVVSAAAIDAGHPGLSYATKIDDPLDVFGMECTPAVATPFGNLSHEFDQLLKRLASQAVQYREDALPSTLPSLARKIQRNLCVKRYRAIITCAAVRGLVGTYTANPSLNTPDIHLRRELPAHSHPRSSRSTLPVGHPDRPHPVRPDPVRPQSPHANHSPDSGQG